MSNNNNPRIQELFLAALEISAERRDAWLVEQCGYDRLLLREVRLLLEFDSPDDDPLEKQLDEAIDLPNTIVSAATTKNDFNEHSTNQVDSEQFISKLSEVGVLSADEIEALNRAVASEQSSADPRHIASQLVTQGKLTDYQASALLRGQPELLIDKYLILDLLDAGGMGMVFKAIHRPMNRTVAVKMIAQHLLSSPDQVKRFQREVRVAATLEHPNIVRSYDADQSRGVHFLVMEYVRGQNLNRIVQRDGPMSVELAVDCIRQAAIGLRYAQKKGVIHRDIKPGNLMLGDEGTLKILDLGLANIDESFRLAQQNSATGQSEEANSRSLAESELTTAGTVLGTVSFMAPEQSLDARKADTRADIYSLGCTLYYLLIGEAPYKGETIFQVFTHHRETPIPSLRNSRPDVPEKVEAVCHKMLAKDPDDRYQSMGELLAGIEDCDISPPPETLKPEKSRATSISDIGSTVPHASRGSQTVNRPRSRSLLGWVSALVLLLAFAGGYWWWQNNGGPDNPLQTQTAEMPPVEESDATPATQHVGLGKPQYALRFDGDGDYVELPHFDYDGKSSLTIEFWYEPTSNQRNKLISIDGLVWVEGTDDSRGWRLVGMSGERQQDRANALGSQVIGNRSHWAVVFDGHAGAVFLNGEKQKVALSRWSADAGIASLKELTFPTEHRRNVHKYSLIGGLYRGHTDNFIGTIDEVRISTSVRYTEDFTPADRFEADEDTLALYHFDEGEGDVLTDSSGNGHHGKIVDAKWVRLDEKPQLAQDNRALRFDGGKLHLPELVLQNAEGFTCEATVSLQEDRWNTIFFMFDESSKYYFVRSPNGDWVATVKEVGKEESARSQARAAASVQANQMYNVAVVLGDNKLRLFVDGNQLAAESIEDFPLQSLGELSIGVHHVEQAFYGSIDEVHFSSIARYTEDYTPVDRFIPDQHTVALYHCDEDGSTLIDSSGNGYHVDLKEAVSGNVSRISVYDEANMSAADLLATGEYEWRVVEKLPEPISSPRNENSADMTRDGLTIFFNSWREEGGYGRSDLWMASRFSIHDEWGAPVNLGDNVNSEYNDWSPSISYDGLQLLFTRYDDPSGNTTFISRRDTINSPWSKARPFDFQSQWSPDFTADQKSMLIDDKGSLAIASRATANSSWPDPTELLLPIDRDTERAKGTLSDDGRLLVFEKYSITDAENSSELWFMVRKSRQSAWSKPNRIDTGKLIGKSPRFASDGKSFLFSSKAWMIKRNADIYVAKLVRKLPPPDANSKPWLSAADLLATGDYEWKVMERLPEPINSNAGELGAHMTTDLKTIVFASQRTDGSFGAHDLWTCTRPSLNDPWSDPVNLGAQINSERHETRPVLSPDGLTLYFERVGLGSFIAKRKDARSSWGPAQAFVRETIGTPWVTSDGQAMVYTAWHQGSRDLWLKRRHSDKATWLEPTRIESPINTEAWEAHATISDDGRLLLFDRSRDRPPEEAEQQVWSLWMATRQSWSSPWSEPVPIESVNFGTRTRTPALLADGKSFLFDSLHDSDGGDIYLARLVRKDTPRDQSLPETLDAYADGKWISILPSEGHMDYWNTWIAPDKMTLQEDGCLIDSAGGSYTGFQFGNIRVRDIIMRGKVKRLSAKHVKLNLRRRHPDNYYLRWNGGSRLEIVKRHTGPAPTEEALSTVLASKESEEFDNEVLDFAFAAIGSNLEVYVNGELVLSAHDSELEYGEPGIDSWAGQTLFQSLEVQILDPPSSSIGPLMDAEEWQEAIKFGEARIHEKTRDAYRWLQVGPAYALSNDNVSYRDFCERMLKQFAGSNNEIEIERIIHAGLLLPKIVDAETFPGKKLIQAVSETEKPRPATPWSESACALWAYRTGDFEQAIRFALQSNSRTPQNALISMNHSILAMSYQQQGDSDLSQQSLEAAAKALEYCREHYKNLGVRYPHPQDYWMPYILYQEAKSTVHKPRAGDDLLNE